MPALNAKSLFTTMFKATHPLVANDAEDVRELLQMQLRTLANVACDIEKLHREKKIDADGARLLFEMQRNAARAGLTALEKIGVSAAERLLTAATSALGDVVLIGLGLRTTAPAGGGVRANFKAGKDL